MVGCVEEDVLVKSLEVDCIVIGYMGVDEEGSQVVINFKFRKCKVKEFEVIDFLDLKSEGDVFDVKDGKKMKDSEEELNDLFK